MPCVPLSMVVSSNALTTLLSSSSSVSKGALVSTFVFLDCSVVESSQATNHRPFSSNTCCMRNINASMASRKTYLCSRPRGLIDRQSFVHGDDFRVKKAMPSPTFHWPSSTKASCLKDSEC